MIIPKFWRVWMVITALVVWTGCFVSNVWAASSSASAQVIIIIPERYSSPSEPDGVSHPVNPFSTDSLDRGERTTTVLHDGEAVTILHTEIELF